MNGRCESFECEYDVIPQSNGEVYHCIMRKGLLNCKNKQCFEYGRCTSCKNRDTGLCPKGEKGNENSL